MDSAAALENLRARHETLTGTLWLSLCGGHFHWATWADDPTPHLASPAVTGEGSLLKGSCCTNAYAGQDPSTWNMAAFGNGVFKEVVEVGPNPM